jgi:hypothetical protein
VPIRRAAAVALALTLAALVLGALACGSRTPEGPKIPRAVLRVVSNVPDAKIWVDERYIGPVGALPGGMRIAAGEHRLEVRHDRYHTRYVELTLAPNEVRTVEVTLVEALP